MSEREELLRETARQLLADESVDVVIGYEKGTLPLRTTPCFVREPEDVGRLVWDRTCTNNLASFLHEVEGKVAIVAKGCDGRSVVIEMSERQISRENLVVIGVPCEGMVDRRKVDERLGGREVLEARFDGDQLIVSGDDFQEAMNITDVLLSGCQSCQHRNPPLYDVLIGNAVEEAPAAQEDLEVAALEAMSQEERWEHFSDELGRCIRCYACREACPSCYCPVCFVDQSQPTWFPNSDKLSDIMAFHMVRVYHTAGRCLDCGACERACPMEISLRPLMRLLSKDVESLYGFEPGMDPEAAPALASFRTDDPNSFVK
jgi:formate dehydrogenase (coenzyme F420) beta subunit